MGTTTEKAAPKAKAATAPEAKETPFELASDLIAELTQTNFDETIEAANALMAAKDPKTAFEVQSDFMTSAFKRNLDGMRKLNELTASAMRDSMVPFQQRWTEAFEKFRAV